MNDRLEKFLNSRRSRMAKTVTIRPWWQPLYYMLLWSFFFLFFLSFFFLFATQKSVCLGGGRCLSMENRMKNGSWLLRLNLLNIGDCFHLQLWSKISSITPDNCLLPTRLYFFFFFVLTLYLLMTFKDCHQTSFLILTH